MYLHVIIKGVSLRARKNVCTDFHIKVFTLTIVLVHIDFPYLRDWLGLSVNAVIISKQPSRSIAVVTLSTARVSTSFVAGQALVNILKSALTSRQ